MINNKTKKKPRRVATFNGDKVVWHATLKKNKFNVSVIDVHPGEYWVKVISGGWNGRYRLPLRRAV